ncbi:MAG: hypothetical protein AAFV29_17550, partial [Myxococcota bacterium]
ETIDELKLMIADAERRGYRPFADYWRRTLEEVLQQPEFDLELQGRPVAEPAQAELEFVWGD